MNRLELPALTADSVLGFLGALGTLRVVADELGDTSARLGWPSGPYAGAVVETSALGSVAELVDAVNGVVEGMRTAGRLLPALDGFPPRGADASSDPTAKLSIDDGRGLVRRARDDDALARWLPALVSLVPPIDKKSGQPGTLEKTRFLKAGPGTVWVARTLAGVLASVGPTSIDEAFTGWRRRDGFIGAYLDQRADVEAATGQSVKAPPKRGVPGATFLALQALPLLPGRTPGQFATETVGWAYGRGLSKGFAWPVWGTPLPLESVVALLDHPVVAAAAKGTGATDTQLRCLGLSTVFRSLRVAAGNNDAAMAPATAVWSRV